VLPYTKVRYHTDVNLQQSHVNNEDRKEAGVGCVLEARRASCIELVLRRKLLVGCSTCQSRQAAAGVNDLTVNGARWYMIRRAEYKPAMVMTDVLSSSRPALTG